MNREGSSTDEFHDITNALLHWQQGDCVLGVNGFIYRFRTEQPATSESRSAGDESDLVEADVPGFVVATQTCDIQRAVRDRPFIDICTLVVCPDWTSIDEIAKGLRPRFAYVPGVAERGLVADLDQIMTIEKPVLASWPRIQGCRTDAELRIFAGALARKFSRFAFPDDFVAASRKLVDAIKRKHGRPESDEGRALRALREIRVAATPSWNAAQVALHFFFIRDEAQPTLLNQTWDHWLTKWLDLLPTSGRYISVDGIALPLSAMRADEYIASDQLDLDNLTSAISPR